MHGLADYNKRIDVIRYLFGRGANVLFLQETHARPIESRLWKYTASSEAVYHAYGPDDTAGVAIIIDKSTDHKVHSSIVDSGS